MAKGSTRGTFALLLAGLAFAFTVYLAMWNNNQHDTRYGCGSERVNQYTEQNCSGEKEDKNLMLGAGAVAVGLLAFGLIRRYQPGGRAPKDAATD